MSKATPLILPAGSFIMLVGDGWMPGDPDGIRGAQVVALRTGSRDRGEVMTSSGDWIELGERGDHRPVKHAVLVLGK